MQLRLVVYVPVDRHLKTNTSHILQVVTLFWTQSDLFGALSDLYSDNQARSL